MYLKAHLLIIFFSISLFTFAQTENDYQKLLQGKWVLEDASVYEANGSKSIIIDNIKTYSEIAIKEDNIVFVDKKDSTIQKEKYTIDKNNISVESASFHATWRIFENKLHLQQIVKDPFDESIILIISLVYIQK